MKNITNKTIIATLIALFTLSVTSCNKESGLSEAPPQNSIGTYSFDNREYKLVSAGYDQDPSYIYFMFASQDIITEKVSSYFTLSLRTEFLDKGVILAEEHTHNYDYIFILETPTVFYSKFKKVTGQMSVKQDSTDNFTVKLNLKLADQKPFTFDYTGKVTKLVQQ